MYWQTRQKRRMGVDVTKFLLKNLLRMVSKREGNPGPRVTLARGFKVIEQKETDSRMLQHALDAIQRGATYILIQS